MDYFTVAISTAWILGVSYTALAILIAVGLEVSEPTVETRAYHLLSVLIGASFLGAGVHYLHLGYFGATHGILPSQESLVASISNVAQAICLPLTIALAWYLRWKVADQTSRIKLDKRSERQDQRASDQDARSVKQTERGVGQDQRGKSQDERDERWVQEHDEQQE